MYVNLDSHRLKFADKIYARKKCKEIFLMCFYKKINFVKCKNTLAGALISTLIKELLEVALDFRKPVY